jgi:asparagine synthetase A
VVQSLAKWKRVMLGRLGCKVGEGIYCDSTSIRKGYKVSSFFVNVRILHWCCCANGKSFHVYEG